MKDTKPGPASLVIPLLGLSLLVFLLGTAVVQFRLFPYPQFLEPAYLALDAYLERGRILAADAPGLAGQVHWRRVRTPERGVTTYEPERSAGGYTLYTSSHLSAAHLIDERGDTVHRWELPFREVWPEPEHVQSPVPESDIHWSQAVVLPDGGLVAHYLGRGDTPYGYGMVRVDRDSNLVWAYSGNTHHQIQLQPDSTLLTLVHGFRRIDPEGPLGGLPLEEQVLEDAVVRLSLEGEVVDSLNLLEAFARSDFRWVLESSYLGDDGIPRWDVLHANAISEVSAEFASRHEFAEPGMWLISMRSPSLLVLVDPRADSVVWVRKGFWRHQHDPQPLPNGNVMVFDNLGRVGEGGRSRVVEIDLDTDALVWSYAGTPEEPFYSEFGSQLQVLPNDNVLIIEANSGRIFEVTRDGEIVWEWWNPDRVVEEGVEYVASVTDGKRVFAEEVPFLDAGAATGSGRGSR